MYSHFITITLLYNVIMYMYVSKWKECKWLVCCQCVSGVIVCRPVHSDQPGEGVVLQVVTSHHGQHQQDAQHEDDEYEEESAAVVLTQLCRGGGLVLLLTARSLRLPLVVESVVPHSVLLLRDPVIVLGLLLLLLLLLSSAVSLAHLNTISTCLYHRKVVVVIKLLYSLHHLPQTVVNNIFL